MDFPILGQVCPNFKPVSISDDRKDYGKSKYGWRKSVHKGWMQCLPHLIGGPNDWATEAEMFIGQLGENSPDYQVQIYAISAEGEIKKKKLLHANRDWDNALELYGLKPDLNNIMFDPVLWKNGRRLKSTRLGFATTTGWHPFDLFPEPVMYWTIGPNAYQFLLPWHEQISLKENKRRLEVQDHNNGQNLFFPKRDLMHMPGSLVHKPNMPPVTAAVLFDAFSTTEVENHDALWSKY